MLIGHFMCIHIIQWQSTYYRKNNTLTFIRAAYYPQLFHIEQCVLYKISKLLFYFIGLYFNASMKWRYPFLLLLENFPMMNDYYKFLSAIFREEFQCNQTNAQNYFNSLWLWSNRKFCTVLISKHILASSTCIERLCLYYYV